MRLKNLRLKLKIVSLKRFLIRNIKRKSRKVENGKRVTWMDHVSHGYRVVKLGQTWTTPSRDRIKEFDPIVVQREQTEDCELWFFGVFDDEGVAEEVTKSMQSNFFNKLPKQSNMGKKCKETMERAHLQARSNMIERNEGDADAWKLGSASAMVINGEKLVMANTGGYTAVVCRDGEAYQICRKKLQPTTQKWPLALFSGGLRVPKIQKTVNDDISKKSTKSSEVGVGSEMIDSETEFVILASTGVWEVMKQQEAVNLIRHIDNAQAAAECLATEALIRKTKTIVSCLIIRFH
ncbi:hypothetical protein C2S52_014880 [Perilla frutescens var. hirtella]|uniref:PPM-type phosphatase domain-containing protein n=1 Tax=Perilla frutescens var. hirtella TaxID=608512 RepID=A0AAD4IV59_PERFH|nr:hypothetical protein C2S52_014880 [Perilla frutescens var. hirtella]KAH6816284.1 hypothetical protein C2S51_021104 [Perilla frutescens var. frutescens]KAH6821911.1 hypothetical protein C2S53_002796 [Perilla frutescens var. hirtella]